MCMIFLLTKSLISIIINSNNDNNFSGNPSSLLDLVLQPPRLRSIFNGSNQTKAKSFFL